jgi:hypothetical protein
MSGQQAARTDELDLTPGLDFFDKRLKEERAHRIETGKNVLTFGVPFLDEALGGIYSDDLVLLGARSGLGKTQQGILIATANASLGKRVVYFGLEAGKYELERRIKYQFLAKRFFSDPNRPKVYFNYLDWAYGRLDGALDQYEKEIDEQGSVFPTLKTFYRTERFGADQFARMFMGIKDETDLVILDHLHYFDLDDDDRNENRAVKSLVKKIKDCCELTGKPVVLISHIRKGDRKFNKELVPGLEDFHGTSDIGKIATKAITLAPSYSTSTEEIRKTYFYIPKCRIDGSRMNAAAVLAFNMENHSYQKGYYLGRFSPDLSEFQALEGVPRWAKSAQNGKGPNE